MLCIARGLLFTVGRDGSVKVWQPTTKQQVTLDASLVSLLLPFGEGKTVEDACADAGVERDDAVDEAIAFLCRTELLIDAHVPAAVAAAPSGPLPALQRIEELVDPQTFEQLAPSPITTGFAKIDGRRVAVASWKPGAAGGVEDVIALQERVLAEPCPIIYVIDLLSVGRTAADFIGPRAVGRIYANQARLSGVAPQVAIVAGPLWRPAALLPVGCDLVIFVEGQASVHMADIDLVKQLTGEDVTRESLGGARVHAEGSGLAHLVARSTAEAAAAARRYLSFMPVNRHAALPVRATGPAPAIAPAVLDALVPDDADRAFPIEDLVRGLLDEGSPLELRPAWARELSTTLGRLDGIPVGVIANCSQHKAGVITVEAADKAARFITLCDAYGLPLLFLVDVLGLAIGRAAERAGIERAAGRMFSAIATAAVPKLTLVVRRAHTAGLYAMCGPAFDPDAFLALPTASISIVSERAAVGSAAALERVLDPESRDSLRQYLRAVRTPISETPAEMVRASEARLALSTRLRSLLVSPRARTPRSVPP